MTNRKTADENADQYRKLIEKVGLNQSEAARFLMIDGRTSRRYADGSYEVKPITAMLLAVMAKYNVTPAEARKLAGLEKFEG
jgi:hypothetical protein